MNKIRLELSSSTGKRKCHFQETSQTLKSLIGGHFTSGTITATIKAHRDHSNNGSERKGFRKSDRPKFTA